MWFITLLVLIFILGLLVLIHEFGHFIFAKKSGVHIYEFSIGMGPIILKKIGKDNIQYSIRALPIGGYVQMAGEVSEDDKEIPKDKFMCNKTGFQKFLILVAGVTFNFLLAFVLLFVSALIWGSSALKPVVGEVAKGYPIAQAGIEKGDTILAINNKKVRTWDKAQILLNLKTKNDYYTFKVKKVNGDIKEYKVKPKKETVDNQERKVFGIQVDTKKEYGFIPAIKYSVLKFGSVINSMAVVIVNLFTGHLGINALSGPVGIYGVVGQSITAGIQQIIYLIAFLSINLGFINVLPFPAFDGGRILFLIIEKIKGSPVNAKVENMFHTVGFILLMLLMVYITLQDIIKLF